MNIGESLKMIRIYHREKQGDTAEAVSISKSHLSEIESGKKQPTIDVLNRYAKHFSIPVSSLVYIAENIDGEESTRSRIAKKAVELLKWLDSTTR